MTIPTTPSVRLKFWGVRGSAPVPGPSTVSIGGNTTCLELRADGEILILDAGTGIRALGIALEEEFKGAPLNLTLLLTHTHWDHIQGLPFFRPAYSTKNQIRILGCKCPGMGLDKALESQMGSTYFPIPMAEMSANIAVEEINAPGFSLGPVNVHAARVNHPGAALGYRLETGRGTVVFIPDCDPAGWDATPGLSRPAVESFIDATGPGLADFIRGADILIFDSQYDRHEYKGKDGWGHACIDDTVELAMAADVKKLFLFHHDPGHDDPRILEMLANARKQSSAAGNRLIIEAASEGLEVLL